MLGSVLPGQPLYVMKDLGVPANVDSVTPSALNECGEVAGDLRLLGDDIRLDAFVYSHGRVKVLRRLGDSINRATGINGTGLVVGYAVVDDARLSSHAVLYRNKSVYDLGTLGGLESRAYAINNHDEIVGYSYLPNETGYCATVWARGTIRALGTLGGPGSIAYAINDAGQVAGVAAVNATGSSHAFLYTNGQMLSLGTLGGARSQANGLNIWGEVTGYAELSPDRYHAFLFSDGTMTDLGTLVPGKNSVGHGINRWSQVVGECVPVGMDLPDPAIYHAFLYSGRLYDLNDLVLDARGWILTHAMAINDSGQIVAIASHPDSYRLRGFLLTPVSDRLMRHAAGSHGK